MCSVPRDSFQDWYACSGFSAFGAFDVETMNLATVGAYGDSSLRSIHLIASPSNTRTGGLSVYVPASHGVSHSKLSNALGLAFFGSFSCYKCDITVSNYSTRNINTIIASGSYSLSNSNIYSNIINTEDDTVDSDEIELRFYGYYSGYNSTFTCVS